MDILKDCPRVLLQKLMITALIGAGCLVVGAVAYGAARDVVLLALSACVFVSCLLRSIGIYRMLKQKKYTVTEGVCVGITPKALCRYRKVRFMDEQGLETSLLLDKQTKVKIGFHYRVYLKESQRITLGSEYLDTALSGDCFLGMEELGEFSFKENGIAAEEQ